MHLVDGGLRNNVPVDVVRRMGANVVFAIDVNHLRGTGTQSLSTVSVLSATVGIMMQSKVDETLEMADLIFEPALETFSPLKLEGIDEMIKIEHLTKKFGDAVVLDDISMELVPGKIYGLVGRNGSGKTMLMKHILGFVHPTSGKILVNGKEIGQGPFFLDKN